MFLKIDQFPWSFGFGVFRTPLVMSFNSIIKIVSGTDIKAAVFDALEDVDEIVHNVKKGLSCLME